MDLENNLDSTDNKTSASKFKTAAAALAMLAAAACSPKGEDNPAARINAYRAASSEFARIAADGKVSHDEYKQIVTLLRGSSPAWEYRTAGFGGTLGASELVKLDPQNANFRQLNADLTNAARAYENAVINLDKQPSANDGISFVLGISYLNQDKQQRNLGYSMATVSAIHAQQTAEGIYKLLGEEAFRTELSRAGSYIRKTQHNDESGWNKVWTRIPHGDWQALYGNQKVDAKEKNFISDLKYEFRGAGIQAVISSGTVVVGDISLSGPYAPKGNYQKGKK